MLSKESLDQVKCEVAKYPPERKSSAVMAALRIAQEEHGWLSVPLMDYVAELLGMRPIQVYEVASFYSMYDPAPVGRHKLYVCRTLSCRLRGAEEVTRALEEHEGLDALISAGAETARAHVSDRQELLREPHTAKGG